MRFMVSTPAQSSIKSSPNSEILRQRPSAPKSRTKSTLGFVSDGCFLVFHLFGELLKNHLIERNTASTPVCSKITYEKYVRFCLRRVFPCLSSVWRGFKEMCYLAKYGVNAHLLQNHVRKVRWVLFQTGVSLSFICLASF